MARAEAFLVLFALAFSHVKSSESPFRFANVFGNHMVLQQAPKRASIWGFGELGQEVVVHFLGEIYRTFVMEHPTGAKNVGIWTVMLKPTVYGGPHCIRARSKVNGAVKIITLEDILFGDVWMCSGQSNMEFSVIQSDNGEKAINESSHYQNIRLFTAERDCQPTPQIELKKVRLPWSRPSPDSVGGPAWQYMSATCWYYGVQLYEELRCPIGLIASSWSGTPIEVWSSPDALAACGIRQNTEIVNNRKFDPSENVDLSFPFELSCLWNAMIYPFLKMTIHGSIWYQGETNALLPLSPYVCTFPAMIDDWRAKWFEFTQHSTDAEFPFGFVQISAIGNNTKSQVFDFAPLRWDQTVQYGYVPNDRQKNVFMAVAMDLGNPESPYGSIHPTDKTDVGRRLALAGLAVGYGRVIYYTGPLVSSIKKKTDPPSRAYEVEFKSLNTDIEVRSKAGFEVHCKNKRSWVEAPILNHGPVSVVILPMTVSCVVDQVRYAWSDYPCEKLGCAIYSGGLPAPPFIMKGPFGTDHTSSFKERFRLLV